MKKILSLIAMLLCSAPLFAQPQMSATLQNMHLWRGGEVADGMVLTTDFSYAVAQERLKVGFWGGTNSVGEYKEFNYYATYTQGNFHFALCDTYNFSTYATYNNEEFFNYSPATTGRFLDATIRYSFGEQLPLVMSWSTVLFGRDRDTTNRENRYSTFCSAQYPLYRKDGWQIDAGAGVAFAIIDRDGGANFFGSNAGLVETTLKVSNKIHLNDYTIPLYMLMMWNPQADKAYMQLGVQVISF